MYPVHPTVDQCVTPSLGRLRIWRKCAANVKRQIRFGIGVTFGLVSRVTWYRARKLRGHTHTWLYNTRTQVATSGQRVGGIWFFLVVLQTVLTRWWILF